MISERERRGRERGDCRRRGRESWCASGVSAIGGWPRDVEEVALDVFSCRGSVADGHAEDVRKVEVKVGADGPGKLGDVGEVGCQEGIVFQPWFLFCDIVLNNLRTYRGG